MLVLVISFLDFSIVDSPPGETTDDLAASYGEGATVTDDSSDWYEVRLDDG